MSKWRAPDVVLTGADCFLRAFEYESRRFHGASHLSQLVLRLGHGFDLDAFRGLIAAVARATPIIRAPVGRCFGVGVPVYRLGRAARAPLPVVTVVDVERAPAGRETGDTELPPVFRDRLNARLAIERGELLRFDVVRYAGGAGVDLAMTWAHLLLDGGGSERFVRKLDACFRGAPITDLNADDADHASAPRRTLAERGRAARAWQATMIGHGAVPPRSLGGPRRRVPQALAYEVTTLSPAETAVVTARAGAYAGYLTPVLFYLAATIRAHDAVHAGRGTGPGAYLVPLPVNVRPKGVEGAVFRTHASLLWFHVAREHVADLPALVAELMRQRRAWIHDRLIEKGAVAMDLVRALPARLNAAMARRHLGGELASLYFAFTNEFLPGMDAFCGAPILNGFHVPSVMPSPGSAVIMSLRDGRLNVAHIYQSDAVAAEERAQLRAQLFTDLLGCDDASERLQSSA